MMNRIITAALAIPAGLAATGCASYANYYDAKGDLAGSCTAGAKFVGIPLFPFGGHCYAFASPAAYK
jgi:hypothetical protein